MAIGKYQIQLGADQLVSGMSSSDFATDGALGVSSNQLNPFAVPGVMYSLAAPTDISTNVVDNIIASTEDSNASSPNNRYLLGDAANYYSYNGTSITKVKTGTATTSYVAGRTDFISFNGNFYATLTNQKLAQWDGGSTLNETFQTFGDINASHPLIAYQGFLLVGDGNQLWSLSTAGTFVSILTLQSKEKIVALGIDPLTGLLMISIQMVYDFADTIPSLKAVYLYDGISSKPTRKILVDDLITAFFNVEGNVYIGSGNTLGVWNGNGVTFLRILKNVSLSNTDLPYKHHFANINRVLHVIDGQNVLSYGSVVAGKKGFFYTANNQTNNTHLTCIFPAGNSGGVGERLGIAYSTSGPTYHVLTFDYGSISAGIGSMYFNNIYFPRPVFIRRMRIITTGITTTNGLGGTALFDDRGNIIQTAVSTFVVRAATSPQYVFDFDYSQLKLQGVQPRLTWDTQGFGIIRVYLYYDIAE